MAGHRPFRDLVADRMKDWSPERRAQYEARKAQFEAEMAATAELTGQAATRAAIEELEAGKGARFPSVRSEEHTSELQSLMRNSYAVFCLKKQTRQTNRDNRNN